MIRRTKRVITLVLSMVFGAVAGNLIANLADGSQYFDWLAFGGGLGISTDNPFVLELGILSLKFGIMFNITVGGIIGMIIAIIVYRRI
ncbi:MAG: hypothetical protein BWY15_00174 [Firmicutes bacterium ADurb.Bin193]|nr:MAG: hypothetical protein BWY15_00174 [Firmicutes bacterium ADurb.Bin193]